MNLGRKSAWLGRGHYHLGEDMPPKTLSCLVGLRRSLVRSFAISQDNDAIYFVRTQYQSDIYLLELDR